MNYLSRLASGGRFAPEAELDAVVSNEAIMDVSAFLRIERSCTSGVSETSRDPLLCLQVSIRRGCMAPQVMPYTGAVQELMHKIQWCQDEISKHKSTFEAVSTFKSSWDHHHAQLIKKTGIAERAKMREMKQHEDAKRSVAKMQEEIKLIENVKKALRAEIDKEHKDYANANHLLQRLDADVRATVQESHTLQERVQQERIERATEKAQWQQQVQQRKDKLAVLTEQASRRSTAMMQWQAKITQLTEEIQQLKNQVTQLMHSYT